METRQPMYKPESMSGGRTSLHRTRLEPITYLPHPPLHMPTQQSRYRSPMPEPEMFPIPLVPGREELNKFPEGKQRNRAAERLFMAESRKSEASTPATLQTTRRLNNAPYIFSYAAALTTIGIEGAEFLQKIPEKLLFGLSNPDILANHPIIVAGIAAAALILTDTTYWARFQGNKFL